MFPEVVQKLEKFIIDDLSKTYIQIIRERENEVSDLLNKIRKDLLIVLAPIIPFITENIWQELRKKKIVKEESVHLCGWPKADKKRIDKKLEGEFDIALQIIEKGLAARDKEKIGLRWPLQSADITAKFSLDKDMEEIIKNQLNVKEVFFDRIEKLDIPSVKLDKKQTPGLEAEGYAREMSRKVQAFRKKLGLKKKDRIELFIITDDKFKKTLEKNKSFIQDRTNSKNINIVTTDKEKFKNKINFVIKDKRGKIAIIITNK
jgi:isoleucyl-tRNA synthetase